MCSILYGATDKFSRGELQVMPHVRQWVPSG
jgi:hypothetical protein